MSYYVYITTNANKTALYTGMTNDLVRRISQHRSGHGSKFTQRYHTNKLVFYERFDKPNDAVAAEKKIKSGSRSKKEALIEVQNPFWRDLTKDI